VSRTRTLVLLRHGESIWNAANRFAGWVDVPLSERGRTEARRSGELLRDSGLLPEVVHTSLLRRAVSTADIALDVADRHWVPVRRTWRLNERHYGALQGQNRERIRAEFGDTRFRRWRRGYDVAPPPIAPGSPFGQDSDPRYAELGVQVPSAESLADVLKRLLPYWKSGISPDLRVGRTVLVVAHGNVLRALIKHLDGLSGEEVTSMCIPTGVPLRYDLTQELRPVVAGGVRLDATGAQTRRGVRCDRTSDGRRALGP
jgi:2,3-bisphosphoglycerate-dependent phosphoglycerate mutase